MAPAWDLRCSSVASCAPSVQAAGCFGTLPARCDSSFSASCRLYTNKTRLGGYGTAAAALAAVTLPLTHACCFMACRDSLTESKLYVLRPLAEPSMHACMLRLAVGSSQPPGWHPFCVHHLPCLHAPAVLQVSCSQAAAGIECVSQASSSSSRHGLVSCGSCQPW